MSQRLKILICAYACSPYRGSEPGVGWGFVSEMARHHDLWVIVESEKCRTDIERFLAENPEFGKAVRFYFIEKKRNRLLRRVWPPSYYWYYRRWHREAFGLATELMRTIRFDLVHQLTMVGFREPGYMWKLGLPFVWGPVGGMGQVPWKLLPTIGWWGATYYTAYNIINALHERMLARPRKAARIAGDALLLATKTDARGAEKFWGCQGTLMPEVGLPPGHSTIVSRRGVDEPLEIVWVGQHTPGKALDLGLHALGQLPSALRWRLTVLGRGSRTQSWEGLAHRLGIERNCEFKGWIDRSEVLESMQRAHVLLITSLRDLTSTVTTEALSRGLPIVCLDHCGFGNVVDESCGIKVPITGPRQVIAGIRDSIVALSDEDRRVTLARGALERSKSFEWHRKGEVLNAIYRRKLNGHGS
jgi:glycosyltransferase involved in cell wall biosynthesis